jgi:dCMP deaminase
MTSRAFFLAGLVGAASILAIQAALKALRSSKQRQRKEKLSDPRQILSFTKSNKTKADPYSTKPRSGYLTWDDYFMNVAFLSAQRSKDPNKQVGACIVGPEHVILGIGYNGFPRGCSDDKLPWSKLSKNSDELETKYPYVCHAEMNAVMNKNQSSLSGSIIYVTMFPCNECSKILIQAGIKEVVYFEAKHLDAKCSHSDCSKSKTKPLKPSPTYEASMRLLDLAGIKLRQHIPTRSLEL